MYFPMPVLIIIGILVLIFVFRKKGGAESGRTLVVILKRLVTVGAVVVCGLILLGVVVWARTSLKDRATVRRVANAQQWVSNAPTELLHKTEITNFSVGSGDGRNLRVGFTAKNNFESTIRSVGVTLHYYACGPQAKSTNECRELRSLSTCDSYSTYCYPSIPAHESRNIEAIVNVPTYEFEGLHSNETLVMFWTPLYTAPPPHLTPKALANMEYRADFGGSGKPETIRLADGEGNPGIERFWLDKEHVAFGDLDGDGVEDAVVVLGSSGGGSGTFYYLVAVLNRDGQGKSSAVKHLGDRIKINGINIGDGVITVDMITQGPNDPRCCPTKRQTFKLAVQQNEFVAVE